MRVGDNTGYTSHYEVDTDDQPADNYSYDAMGNLTGDIAEDISSIDWNVYGKISSITKGVNTISYGYDAAGNRISKTAGDKQTFYVRDASGNTMSVYEKEGSDPLRPIEQWIYGSSRLGLQAEHKHEKVTVSLSGGFDAAFSDVLTRGEKFFELSNHLGNVLATVSDRKIAHDDDSDGEIDYYTADVITAQDYYPFGMQMPGRTWSSSAYRYGFTGHEKMNEINGAGNAYDMGARLYDPRIGRTPSVDPKAGLYPSVSPYVYALNTPIQAKDPDGNVVIFINGQHTGEGGSAKYWGGYDQRAMNAIGDHSARYVDGALGGFDNTLAAYDRGYKSTSWWEYIGHKGYTAQEAVRMRNGVQAVINESNVNRNVREQAGYAQGGKDANGVFANLTEGESIKIVTHSMGSAFSRGYIKALQEYMKTNNITDHAIELVIDVNAFQGAELNAIPGVKTLNKTGGNDGKSIFKALWYRITKGGISVPSVGKVNGAEDITTQNEKNNSHEIDKMATDGIPKVGNAGTQSHKPVEQSSNNGEPVKKDK